MIRPLPSTPHGLRGEIQDLEVRKRYELQRIEREPESHLQALLDRIGIVGINFRIQECRRLLQQGDAT